METINEISINALSNIILQKYQKIIKDTDEKIKDKASNGQFDFICSYSKGIYNRDSCEYEYVINNLRTLIEEYYKKKGWYIEYRTDLHEFKYYICWKNKNDLLNILTKINKNLNK